MKSPLRTAPAEVVLFLCWLCVCWDKITIIKECEWNVCVIHNLKLFILRLIFCQDEYKAKSAPGNLFFRASTSFITQKVVQWASKK